MRLKSRSCGADTPPDDFDGSQAQHHVQRVPASSSSFPSRRYARCGEAIIGLADDPHPPGSALLQGIGGCHYLAIDDYHILYHLDEGRALTVARRASGPPSAAIYDSQRVCSSAPWQTAPGSLRARHALQPLDARFTRWRRSPGAAPARASPDGTVRAIAVSVVALVALVRPRMCYGIRPVERGARADVRGRHTSST